ncbi:MAG: CYTH domain-containing protein [Paludibacterium sp.]|uniref:CYTH domain-containing protein n=1 Tax=Paludibacterium sp. TaxID=1917523 RepID=UPI0025EFA1A0|nr:CYTH domain-containing protein [Paludibacterium sp.]MBV8047620.1 CYTH domain-containing protein [Paludibacterium sp.]MBV8648008.1 CYTH domain-containing protein [Paludibacterium sp.]
MGMEIERRFLVNGDGWRGQGKTERYRQGYLSVDPARTVRVRVVGDQAWLTIKAKLTDTSRYEFEYDIPLKDAEEILNVMCPMQVDKQRTRLTHAGMIWEVDEFFGANAGLVLAEIELPSEQTPFASPDWLGGEVTADGRFTNAWLADHPYASWVDHSE